MAETLSLISIISFIVAGVFLVLSIFFWFIFKIPTVIGDLTGRTAKKSIAKMRENNEKTGVKSYKESKTNASRGKLTGKIPKSETVKKKAVEIDQPETGILSENKADNLDIEETGILDSEATSLLVDDDLTTLLNVPSHQLEIKNVNKRLVMIDEVILIHTEEVIG